MLKISKKSIIFIFFNIVTFCFLYFIIIFPIKYENYYDDYINLYEYSEKINIIDIPDFFIKTIDNVEIINNEYINFDDNAIFKISKNNLHKRGLGQIIIIGNYDSLDDLKKFLLQINQLDKIDILLENNKIIIYDEENTVGILFIEDGNQIKIDYRTTLPYKVINIDQEFDKIQSYYLEKNFQKHLYMTKLINQKIIYIFLIIIFIDLLIITAHFLNKKRLTKLK